MSLPLAGKSALITGGSRGIGRAIAERLAAEGAAVVVNYARNKERAQEVVSSVESKGGKAFALQANVSQPEQIRRLFSDAEKVVGLLDIVVANAGVHISKPLIESTEEDYDFIFNTNTKGVFFVLQEAGRRMRSNGRIVVVSTGGTKMRFSNMSLYLGSKGAIEQFARSLALELGPRKIAVDVLSPGFTDTEMMIGQFREYGASLSPFHRIGTPQEVADVAAFLASDASRCITGENIQAGGGVA